MADRSKRYRLKSSKNKDLWQNLGESRRRLAGDLRVESHTCVRLILPATKRDSMYRVWSAGDDRLRRGAPLFWGSLRPAAPVYLIAATWTAVSWSKNKLSDQTGVVRSKTWGIQITPVR